MAANSDDFDRQHRRSRPFRIGRSQAVDDRERLAAGDPPFDGLARVIERVGPERVFVLDAGIDVVALVAVLDEERDAAVAGASPLGGFRRFAMIELLAAVEVEAV